MITEVVVPDNNLQARLWTKQGTGGKLFYSYFDPHTYYVGWEKSTTQFGLPNWMSSDAGGGTVRARPRAEQSSSAMRGGGSPSCDKGSPHSGGD
jgi:hypothetical protein